MNIGEDVSESSSNACHFFPVRAQHANKAEFQLFFLTVGLFDIQQTSKCQYLEDSKGQAIEPQLFTMNGS